MATHEVSIPTCPAQPPTITSKQISRYAEVTALVSELENRQKALRAELLSLRAAGAEQETDSPYLLAFIDQERRTVDWKAQAFSLAEKLYGMEKAASWKAGVENTAPVQTITQVRVKPNPAFAAGLTRPVTTVRIPLNLGGNRAAVATRGE